jgi:hypothetical protein
VTVKVTRTVCPDVEGLGSTSVISVVEPALATVITGLSSSVTPPATAVIVFASATVERKEKNASPSSPEVADAGEIVLPLPDELTDTATPSTALPLASRTRTIIVLLSPTWTVPGATVTREREALGPPTVAVALKVAVPTPDTTALTVLFPADPRVQLVLA